MVKEFIEVGCKTRSFTKAVTISFYSSVKDDVAFFFTQLFGKIEIKQTRSSPILFYEVSSFNLHVDAFVNFILYRIMYLKIHILCGIQLVEISVRTQVQKPTGL